MSCCCDTATQSDLTGDWLHIVSERRSLQQRGHAHLFLNRPNSPFYLVFGSRQCGEDLVGGMSHVEEACFQPGGRAHIF